VSSIDCRSLLRRAKAAAESAALRYKESCGGFVHCTFIGQHRGEDDSWPRLSDCELDPQAWVLPTPRVDRVRLLFKWDIMEEGCAIPIQSDNSVVSLKDAEQQGVPLPDEGWGPLIVASADSVTAKGVR
jgi:hypothetical protein